jgi:hypothetical protein
MPTAVFSFKVDDDGSVTLLHVAFDPTKSGADRGIKQHADICPKFGPAFRTNQTIEFAREIAEMPPSDSDELEEWLEDFLGETEEAEDDAIEVDPE